MSPIPESEQLVLLGRVVEPRREARRRGAAARSRCADSRSARPRLADARPGLIPQKTRPRSGASTSGTADTGRTIGSRGVRLLVLGGTVFVGRHVVEAALEAGHEVSIFTRGQHGAELFPEVERLRGDRDGDLSALGAGEWDAVVDTSRLLPAPGARVGRGARRARRPLHVRLERLGLRRPERRRTDRGRAA